MAMQKVRFSVEGLHCTHCADNLTRVLSLIRGVSCASVDLKKCQLEGFIDDDHVS
jgi:copper chaperone CopZ